ncbi:hypothetical protein BBJ28_00010376 [Nothophytophthora sp. Chile5]|nr:hypothetical protein BBJ28_00010376 [Nothophytophthora sp. Chile5]
MSLLSQPMAPAGGNLSAGVYLSPFSAMLSSSPSTHDHAHTYSTTHKPKERPFRCEEPGCDRRFNRKFTLSEHMKTHTGEKPYVCPVVECSRRFSTSGNLARHKRLHASLKPFDCEINGCKRSFPSQEKLDHHVKIHVGRRTHVCRVSGCTKTFSTAGNLTRHTKNRHPELTRNLFPSSNFSRPMHIHRSASLDDLRQPLFVSAARLEPPSPQTAMASNSFPKLEPLSPVFSPDSVAFAFQDELAVFQTTCDSIQPVSRQAGETSLTAPNDAVGDINRCSLSLLDEVIQFELTKSV